jgi:hypothetical protein
MGKQFMRASIGSTSAPSHTDPQRGGSTAIVGVTSTSTPETKFSMTGRPRSWVLMTAST